MSKLCRINNNLHLKSFPFLLVFFQINTIPFVSALQTKLLCTYLFWHFWDKRIIVLFIEFGERSCVPLTPSKTNFTEHTPVRFSVSSSSVKLFVGFCLKYIFWFPGQIFAASPQITAILLKCETNSNNLPFLIILQPFYTSFPSHCRKLAYLEYEHNFPNIAKTIVKRVNWLWILSSKQKDHDLGQKVHDCAHLLLFIHTLCMNYVITMFLLVSCMNTCNLLYLPGFVHNQPPR